jgi:hypothetical protein
MAAPSKTIHYAGKSARRPMRCDAVEYNAGELAPDED